MLLQISGVGVFAGLPYLTASGLSGPGLQAEVSRLAGAGLIDPVENLAGDNVYIWHGQRDSVVPFGQFSEWMDGALNHHNFC